MSEQREAVAEAIREGWHENGFYARADLAPGWLDGLATITAEALLDSSALTSLLAEAEQRGARGVRHMAERAVRKGYDLDPQEVLDALPQDPDTPTAEDT